MAFAPCSRFSRLIPALMVVVGLGISTGACMGMGTGPSGPDPFDSSGPGLVFMEVRNTLEQEVTVRVRAGRFSQDLGSVQARSMTRVSFPWANHGRLSVQIEPAMGGRFTFPPREVVAGDILDLVIQQPLERSQLRR